MAFKVTWLGHAAFSLDMDGVKVLVDPFLTGNPMAAVSANDVEADYIVVSHGHGDHVGDTVAIAKRTGAVTISNVEISRWLAKQGVKHTQGLNTGGSGQFDFGRVELTIAFHSSGLPDGSYGGMPNGVVLTNKEGKKFYYGGDTALFSDMRLIGDKGIDVAALPICDWYTMCADDAVRAVEFIRPKLAIPIHFDTWPVIAADAMTWAKQVEEKGFKVKVLKPGESVEL